MGTTRILGAAAVVAGALLSSAAPAAALECSATYPTQTQTYVCGLYEDTSMLGRIPSENEVGYWTDRVQRFGRLQTVEAFVYSVESMVEVVGDGYRDILGRGADPGSLSIWTDHLRTRTITVETFERSLAASGEFGSKYPTPAAVVEFWYQYVLGRPSDPAGRNAWIAALQAGTRRDQLVAALQNSTEGTNRAIRLLYQEVLERAPSSADLAAWAPHLRANGRAWLLVQLASSGEAFSRAS